MAQSEASNPAAWNAAEAIARRDVYRIGDREFHSRLILGTGKYRSLEENRQALDASGAEMVTVAVRRVDLRSRAAGSLLDSIPPERFFLLPNTAGCYTAEEAIATARLARELLDTPWIKLEVIGDPRTLFPDVPATLDAARALVAEGFTVLPYITDDVVACMRLAELGCPAVMPLAAPIGSGLGIRNPANLRIILESVEVPVIVDAGVGTASDAAIAMELGASAVLMNTGIAQAKHPVSMARAMRLAVEAGRLAYEAGRMPRRLYAQASSPEEGLADLR
jgi:thiazole synthase